jgi:uncharacterized membrane protein
MATARQPGAASPARTSAPDAHVASRRHAYVRGTEEFTRVLTISDGVFAISMTLLVIGIGVPTLQSAVSEHELLRALVDLWPDIVGFLIGFAVIGRYWQAHHQFFALVQDINGGLIFRNLVYLASIAFLPFPTAVLGDYLQNPVAVGAYALAVAAVSALEVVLFRCAYRDGLLRRPPPPHVYRWAIRASTLPVVLFVASVPVAFVSTGGAVVIWMVVVPVEVFLVDRHRPRDADQYLS